MDEIVRKDALTEAQIFEDRAYHYFQKYKNEIDVDKIAYIFSKAFNDMFWRLAEDFDEEV